MSIDYLEAAKKTIANVNGEHPVEQVKSWALVSIAYALIYMAERIGKEVER